MFSRARTTLVPPGKLLTPLENQSDSRTIEQGIDFTQSAYSKFVLGTNGISYHEFWGRWSVGKQVSIFLNHPLQKRFSLFITGGGHGPNVGAQLQSTHWERLSVRDFSEGSSRSRDTKVRVLGTHALKRYRNQRSASDGAGTRFSSNRPRICSDAYRQRSVHLDR